jgi:wobble nucleotide-excising tRNase
MSQSLTEIAQSLKDSPKKVQLIYAFNGIGKTRLSREFRLLVDPKDTDEEQEEQEGSGIRVMYYNAFTEDLFYWDNDLDADINRKLVIRPNGFTNFVLQFLKDQGLDGNIISNFQHFTSDSITPNFSADFSEVTFSISSGDDQSEDNIKISKGEENNFIWCVFYSLLEQVVEILNISETDERATSQFDDLEYVFIDDPVSSLDDNHLIQLAVDIAALIKSSTSNLKFIISTHNPMFYNVLHSELGTKKCYLLNKLEDGSFELLEKNGDSNSSFSYHLHLKNIIEQAITLNQVERFHFTLLRNLYEKTASFLGFPRWAELLPDNKETYYNRVIQFTSHSLVSNEAVAEPSPQEKETVSFLLRHLIDNNNFWQQEN